MGFFRLEYWHGFTFLPPGDLSVPGIEPGSPVSPASTGEFFTTEPSEKPVVGIREASSDNQSLRDRVEERFRCMFWGRKLNRVVGTMNIVGTMARRPGRELRPEDRELRRAD